MGKIIFEGVKDTEEKMVLGNEEDSVTEFTSRVFLRLSRLSEVFLWDF